MVDCWDDLIEEGPSKVGQSNNNLKPQPTPSVITATFGNSNDLDDWDTPSPATNGQSKKAGPNVIIVEKKLAAKNNDGWDEEDWDDLGI